MAKETRIKRSINNLLRSYFDFSDHDIRRRIELNKVKGIVSVRESSSPVLLGIIYDVHQYHQHFVKAALDLKLSFDVINIHNNDWWDKVNSESYDGFLVWPNGMHEALKSVYDSRIKLINEKLKKPVFPEYEAIWLYENKIRCNDWLLANGFHTIPTYIYYNKQDALDFLQKHNLPVVLKTNLGASGKGVYIVKKQGMYKRLIKQSFGEGLKASGSSPFAEMRGYAFIQEFMPDLEEWRMVRIGDAYFGHRKLLSTETLKHSGSLLKGWDRPTDEMLNLLHEITNTGNFKSMNVDIFRSKGGELFVNELHAVFGQSTEHLMILDGVPGRFVITNNQWQFEPGNFVSGHSAKARINYFLEILKTQSI